MDLFALDQDVNQPGDIFDRFVVPAGK
jgi:hypothetical protein